jgi:anti-sigma factor RsiW
MLYLAGELGPKETGRLLAHLARCADCTALAEDLAATQERVAKVWHGNIEPPATLEARVMASVRALPKQRSRWPIPLSHWGQRPSFAFVAAGLGLVILGFVVGRRWPAASGLELARLGDAYNRMLAAAPDAELRDSDPQHLSQQLTPLVRFPVRAVDLQPEGVRLVGGGRANVDSVPMVTLHYDWQGKQISLFEMEGAKRIPIPLQKLGHEADSYYVRKVGDTAFVAWHSGKTDCVMIARSIPMHQLFHFACHACEKQERL